jgi:hypothetical protein
MQRLLVVAVALLGAARAQAADLHCGPVEKGTIEIDGLLEDWKDVEGIDGGGRDANLSFTIKCNVDDKALWLVIDVRDNYFVRTAGAKPGEDHIQLLLGGRRVTIYPGDQGSLKDKLVPEWKGMRTAGALQPKGWAVELGIPLATISGFKPGMPSLPFRVAVADCDAKSSLKTERTVESQGAILFAEGESALEAFLKERNLRKGDIFFERAIVLARNAGARVIMAGKYMAAISDGYLYQELPFRDRTDMKDARVLDLAGDGRGALVVQYTERAAAGSRDVLAVYRFDGDRVSRTLAVEIAKQQGGSRVEDKVSFVKRGKATDIVIEAGSATGFNKDTYKESPAEDMIPILLPWGDERRAHYQFRGDEYLRK